MSSDRTEKPTAKRLRDAREKGKVPRSRDLGQAASLLACVMVFSFLGEHMLDAITSSIEGSLWRMGQNPLVPINPGEVTSIALQSMRTLALVSGPLALGAATAVVALQAAQGGILFATEAVTLDFSRLSPAQGIKRLLPSQAGIALLKAIVACTVIVAIGWKAVETAIAESGPLTRVSAVAAAQTGWNEMLALLRKAGIALVLLAGADYGVTRWQFMRGHRMTKQEVKDEHKMLEGNPEIKSRVRRIQRELVRRRMLAAVPKATVVITNPTHYAVALEYTRGALPAPRVVAKGMGFLALRIREIARERGVPVVENPPLARALYKDAEVGDLIPGPLFEAVAEVLAYLIRIKQLVL